MAGWINGVPIGMYFTFGQVEEYCAHCGDEVMIDAVPKIQECPECGEPIIPCCMCDMGKTDCEKCQIEKQEV